MSMGPRTRAYETMCGWFATTVRVFLLIFAMVFSLLLMMLTVRR